MFLYEYHVDSMNLSLFIVILKIYIYNINSAITNNKLIVHIHQQFKNNPKFYIKMSRTVHKHNIRFPLKRIPSR